MSDMTPVVLLRELKCFVEAQTKDILLPVRVKEGEDGPKERAPQVHLMRLPNKEEQVKQIPYIVLQFLTGKDTQEMGAQPGGQCSVRIIVVTYSEDEETGAMDVLNVLTRLRVALLKQEVLSGQFLLKSPLEYIVYSDDMAPFFSGEMMTVWSLQAVQGEVQRLWQ